jgi:hypothetical protein
MAVVSFWRVSFPNASLKTRLCQILKKKRDVPNET